MGAELWVSEVAWMGSPEASLNELQRQLLGPDTLRGILPDSDSLLQMSYELLDMLPYLPEEAVPAGTTELINSAIANIETTGVPSGRDEVMAVMAQALGTGSALDIDGISHSPPDAGSSLLATPVSESGLASWFGTAQPELADIASSNAWHPGTRSARFAIAHDSNGPTHVVFAGVSGD